ncbi:uncharacterized protein LOC62_04G005463 [Vanrija pseudolonga]|uniref:Uncharacterized protein n=1 Tax=Vanrija pseudolonga TaxID=143232 RepID=A0AAF0YBZ9_9TREE|nr:hypothetical protein LOC62_04G005463 [Vanrija pseudolonga]
MAPHPRASSPFAPDRIIHGRYTFKLRAHQPKVVLGSAGALDTAAFLPLAALKSVSVMQRYDTTTIIVTVCTTTKRVLNTRRRGPTALEQVIFALNASRMTDLEIAHEVVGGCEWWDRKYLGHAVLYRLDSATLRRLTVDGFGGHDVRFLQGPRAGRIQKLAAPEHCYGSTHLGMQRAEVAIAASKRVASVCVRAEACERKCTCWAAYPAFEPPPPGSSSNEADSEESLRETYGRLVSTAEEHRRQTKATQRAALNLLTLGDALGERDPLPPELWAMVGDYLDAMGCLDAAQFERRQLARGEARLALRARAMAHLANEEFGTGLEEWLSAEGFV